MRPVAMAGALALAGSAATGSYTVRRGDTLSEIAARFGTSTRVLADANAIRDPHRVIAGRTLSVPGQAPSASIVVAPGEALSVIASRHGVSTGVLAEANGIVDPDRLRAGQVLTVPTASTVRGGLPRRLTQSPERLAYVPLFERWAATYEVPEDLLMAMTWLESGWQQGATSSTGAIGIGQLMPDSSAWLSEVLIGEDLDPHDPEDNIRMSARYLRWLLDRNGGDVRLALAGYYQGPRSVLERGLLAETEDYVAAVVSFRDRHF